MERRTREALMGFFDDIYDILTLSRGGRRFLSTLFVASVVAEVDLALSPILSGGRALTVQAWSPAIHAFVAVVEVVLMVATLLFWYLMLRICLRAKYGILRAILWVLAYLIGAFVTAQIYYLLVFRRSVALEHGTKTAN
jgi:hypothetical protein